MDDLLALLENYTCAPDVAADALGVIACLSDSGKTGIAVVKDVVCQPFCFFVFVCLYCLSEDFRSSAKRSIHIRILELLRCRSNHLALVESAVEVLIIYTQLGEGGSKRV